MLPTLLQRFRVARWGLVLLAAAGLAAGMAAPARAERLKDLASIQGVRDNPLIGYGLVVGLDNSGDQTMQTPFTTQSLTNMLSQLGITVAPGTNMQLKNVAAVMVTATLPPFAQPGQQIDVVVSSMGNAKSLRGGTLLMTPLKGADGRVYAIAQGNLLVGGAGASSNGSSVQVNQLAGGRINGGAIVERGVPTTMGGQPGVVRLELNTTDFGTAERVTNAINRRFGPSTANALDGRVIMLHSPLDPSARVDFLAQVENIDVRPSLARAKVILNARTGSVVMNQTVTIDACAVAHGNLSVVINTTQTASQPAPFSNGQTVVVPNSQVSLQQDAGGLHLLSSGASLADVVKALNTLGATPGDLMSILQAMKAAGALHADLEII
ncbi:MAG: flagellar basal body P-ring protein FlgI [Burkholderiales bacterium]|nr:flagellar basal body P-ring protein FlgI [Burkholderiales bacterium]MDE2289172.1 flagellar basal body P-ring protein FlgI [Burkholderiales bacterium]MDE2609385.1 flagellar basal body P-ring protein FlgI [Burkholderiales bacterium]TAL52708.1 MAG: flagellar basal body P-ring protein FlgI [Pandoraea sp.]TAM14328.1 MAG: flagellar basal body P-ring protein FlgI [Pandoraea sp.]